MPKYEIYRQGQLFAEVVKEFSWFNKSFTLDVVVDCGYLQDAHTHRYMHRIMHTAALELHKKNEKYALVTMCVGVGQGYATILEKA